MSQTWKRGARRRLTAEYRSIPASVGRYGQNLAYRAGTRLASDEEVTDASIREGWYHREISSYPGYVGEPDMDNFSEWGHFSQIVWASTSKVGCVVASCPDGMTGGSSMPSKYLVCNYHLPGNVQGRYAENVLPRGTWSDDDF